MKRLFYAGALLSAASFSGLAIAQDQTTFDPTPTGITIRGGIAFALDENLRSVANPLSGIGFDYVLPRSWFRSGESFVSFDYLGKEFFRSSRNIYPICINHRLYGGQSPLGVDTRTYAFLGVGVFFFQRENGATRFGMRGGVGFELSQTLVLEAAAHFSDRSRDGFAANAVGLYVGYRFP